MQPTAQLQSGGLSCVAGMPDNERAHEFSLTTGSTHTTLEGPQEGDDVMYSLPEDIRDVHFATIEEKKRLWVRDAVINALFIAAWCVK
jgi:hypothetical protein